MNSRLARKVERVKRTWAKMQESNYPMQERCGATTRKGKSCQKFAMGNGRCMLHGGKSLSGASHGRYVSGQFTKEAMKQTEKDAFMVLVVTTLLDLQKS